MPLKMFHLIERMQAKNENVSAEHLKWFITRKMYLLASKEHD